MDDQGKGILLTLIILEISLFEYARYLSIFVRI